MPYNVSRQIGSGDRYRGKGKFLEGEMLEAVNKYTDALITLIRHMDDICRRMEDLIQKDKNQFSTNYVKNRYRLDIDVILACSFVAAVIVCRNPVDRKHHTYDEPMFKCIREDIVRMMSRDPTLRGERDSEKIFTWFNTVMERIPGISIDDYDEDDLMWLRHVEKCNTAEKVCIRMIDKPL